MLNMPQKILNEMNMNSKWAKCKDQSLYHKPAKLSLLPG